MPSNRTALYLGCVLALLLVAGTHVEASQYEGEFCWKLTPAGAGPGSYAFGRFGVSHAGDGHYLVHGRITSYESGQPYGPSPANGNAEIFNDEIVLGLTDVWLTGGDFGYSIIQIRIDPTTLDGTFRVLTEGVTPPAAFFDSEYEDGVVEYLADCTLP